MTDTPYSYLDALFPSWTTSYIKAASALGVPPEVGYPTAAFMGGIMCGVWVTLAIAKWRAGRNEREQRNSLMQAIMAVRDELLGYGEVNAERVADELESLESSRHSLWIDPRAWAARSDFLDRARDALNVRRTRDDYRNEIERSETAQVLFDAGNRVIAALRSKAIPPAFDPFEDERLPWLQRVWSRSLYLASKAAVAHKLTHHQSRNVLETLSIQPQ